MTGGGAHDLQFLRLNHLVSCKQRTSSHRSIKRRTNFPDKAHRMEKPMLHLPYNAYNKRIPSTDITAFIPFVYVEGVDIYILSTIPHLVPTTLTSSRSLSWKKRKSYRPATSPCRKHQRMFMFHALSAKENSSSSDPSHSHVV